MTRTTPIGIACAAFLLVGNVVLAQEPQQYDTTALKQYPWEPTMPRDFTRDKLTPADWVGPDGIVYPNWSWAGVHIGEPGNRKTGIPERTDIFTTLSADLAGEANGDAFTDALVEAIDACGEAGGGVIRIPAGTFTLVRPLLIQHDRIVIRGAGRGQAVEPAGRDDPEETRIRFNFAYGVDGEPPVKILPFPRYSRVDKNSVLGFYAQAFSPRSSFASQQSGGKGSHINRFEFTLTPEGKKPVRMAIIKNWNMSKNYDRAWPMRVSGPTNCASLKASDLAHWLKDVDHATFEVTVFWEWKDKVDGEEQTLTDSAKAQPITIDCSQFSDPPADSVYHGSNALTEAIAFVGGSSSGRTWFTRDAHRGDTAIYGYMTADQDPREIGLYPGATARLHVYNSDSWAEAIERDGEGGTRRDFLATVLKVERLEQSNEIKITLEQPLQITFPKNEGNVDTWDPKKRGYVRTGTHSSFIAGVDMIAECGIEDLVLEQTQRIWFNGIVMSDAVNCWLRNVRVERAGRDPARIGGLMNEMRDCELIDPIWANNTGGGSAYLHGSTFSLIENVYGRNMRHAPNFSGSTAGVFHNCRFDSSDMQWHMSWGRAHLMDNVAVDALKGTGSYGWGAFAQRNIAGIHGPGMGPRNVIYHCDLIGPDGGIFLGGKTELPMILHNRVRAWNGPGMVLRYHVFNGIIMGNHFAVQNRFEPAVLFGDPKIRDSRLHKTKERPNPKTHPKLGTANPGNDFINNTLYGGNGKLVGGVYQFGGDEISEWRRSYGNAVKPYDPQPPMPRPAMTSVFQAQRDHPEGFADLDPTKALYNPDPDYTGTPNQTRRDEGVPVAQINFSDQRRQHAEDSEHWHGQKPGEGWYADQGEPFGERSAKGLPTLHFGWVGDTPHTEQQAHWSDPDFRYRTAATWNKDHSDLRPFGQWDHGRELAWQIELDPGRYHVFLAAGSSRKPERFTWPEEHPLPFKQVNAFRINDQRLEDPGQSDVRRDAYWTAVTVGPNRKLVLRPSDEAITPRVNFIQIYRASDR